MLSQFNQELDALFDEKYLVPELLKYYQIPLVLNITSTQFEFYHGTELIKFIPLKTSLAVIKCVVFNNKIYIISVYGFFTYDLTSNKINMLDRKYRSTTAYFKLGITFLIIKYGHINEIWDTTEDKLIKTINMFYYLKPQIEIIIGDQLITVNDSDNQITILDINGTVLKQLHLPSDSQVFMYKDEVVYATVTEIYNLENQLITTIDIELDLCSTIEHHNNNFYIACYDTLHVRGIDNFDLDNINHILSIYKHLIYYIDSDYKLIIYNTVDRTKVILDTTMNYYVLTL